MKDPFEKSNVHFTNSDFYNNELVGFVNWEVRTKNFRLECWNHKTHGPVIVQIWPNGNGFTWYRNIEPLAVYVEPMKDPKEWTTLPDCPGIFRLAVIKYFKSIDIAQTKTREEVLDAYIKWIANTQLEFSDLAEFQNILNKVGLRIVTI